MPESQAIQSVVMQVAIQAAMDVLMVMKVVNAGSISGSSGAGMEETH